MKLVANIKLEPSSEQYEALQATLERCNEACNWISGQAFQAQTFRQFALHRRVYRNCRERFGIGAQIAVRCIAKVADAYKVERPKRKGSGKHPEKTPRRFRNHAAQAFDERIFRFKSDQTISIWTLAGRQTIACVYGEHQRALLKHRKGEVDLMRVDGVFYIACVCEVPDAGKFDIADVLGIDMGIVNIATDSNARRYDGEAVEHCRRKHAHRRQRLQRKGTRAARRKLRRLRRRQSRFQKDQNHCISKAIVETAERSRSAIALEDLKHIRQRVKANKKQRQRLSNWGFSQLRSFIEYKAARAGVTVVTVDPRYTSQGCHACGHVGKSNRPSQGRFQCRRCGHCANADINAARNIRARAVVRPPNGTICTKVAGYDHTVDAPATSRLL